MKPKLGVFSVTGCFGCQLSLAFMENLLDVLEKFEIVGFPMLKEDNSYDVDIAFIEGCACRQEEVEELKKIRKNAGIVVALGACATGGSVQSIKEVAGHDVKKHVYEDASSYNPIEVGGIHKHIDVDYFIYGCPPDKEDLLQFIKDVLVAKKNPKQVSHNVCVECRAKHNVCLLQEGKECVGAVTHGGCGALCPTNGHYCFGCHGLWDDSNLNALGKVLEKNGFSQQKIQSVIKKFDCKSGVLDEDN